MTIKVTVLDDYQQVATRFGPWGRLGDRIELQVVSEYIASFEERVRLLGNSPVVVAMRERTAFPRSLLEKLPQLRLLVTTGMANASIDLDAARELGITVCGTGGTLAATPELTWGLILAVTRGIAAEDARVRAGGWQHTIGPGLAGRTLGIAGLGRLGSVVAGYGAAFGMKVVAWSQNLDADHARALGVEPVGKQELFARSDVVTVHLQLSDRTRGLIGAAELGWMRPDAYLVNTSRGPIIDEKALVAALGERRIAGAALDVFDTEPLPADHPLRSMPNTVLTPHLGYVTTDTYGIFYTDAVEDIAAYLDGNPLRVL